MMRPTDAPHDGDECCVFEWRIVRSCFRQLRHVLLRRLDSSRGRVQVSVDDVLDGHVVGAVHEMVAADDAVRLLADVPAE